MTATAQIAAILPSVDASAFAGEIESSGQVRRVEFPMDCVIGDRVTCAGPWTAPTGASFLAGDVFVVDLVGPVNIRARHERTGAVVWFTSQPGGPRFGSI